MSSGVKTGKRTHNLPALNSYAPPDKRDYINITEYWDTLETNLTVINKNISGIRRDDNNEKCIRNTNDKNCIAPWTLNTTETTNLNGEMGDNTGTSVGLICCNSFFAHGNQSSNNLSTRTSHSGNTKNRRGY